LRLPRDLGGRDFASMLARYGYQQTRQTGSHLRLTSRFTGVEHHLSIPVHASLRVGTLNAILSEVATYLGRERDDVGEELFGR
jgi:predicted RNA binding protein YcfA (HicA-like mRNA interferase family)